MKVEPAQGLLDSSLALTTLKRDDMIIQDSQRAFPFCGARAVDE